MYLVLDFWIQLFDCHCATSMQSDPLRGFEKGWGITWPEAQSVKQRVCLVRPWGSKAAQIWNCHCQIEAVLVCDACAHGAYQSCQAQLEGQGPRQNGPVTCAARQVVAPSSSCSRRVSKNGRKRKSPDFCGDRSFQSWSSIRANLTCAY